MNAQSNTLHIHVSNVSEDVWEFISTLTPKKKAFEIAENAELADRDLFCFTDATDLLLLMPKSIDADFLAYYSSLFPKKYIEVLFPKNHTGVLSQDILDDEALLQKLDTLISSYARVEITSYSSTYAFETVLNKLNSTHTNLVALETPEDNWVTDFYGSKAGFRQAEQDKNHAVLFPMCEGEIVFGARTASSLAALYYKQHAGVVIKTNKGHAGMGVVIIEKCELDEETLARKQIQAKLKEKYWNTFPIVVEQFIDADKTVGGGFPNAECFVDQQGNIEYLYSCGMRVSEEGVFKGVEIGTSVLPVAIDTKLRAYGQTLGQLYVEGGYSGYFDIDCIYGKDKNLYVSESNVRRTGGTHVYLTARAIFGTDFMKKTFALSNNTYEIVDKKQRSFAQLKAALESVLFDSKTKEGLYIVAANLLHRAVFGYIIFGNNKERAYEIEAEMERLLAV